MAFLDYILEPPRYGWQDDSGNLIKPTAGQILREFGSRVNIFKSKKNWLSFMSWLQVACLIPFFFVFIFKFFSWGLLAAAFVYSMMYMGTHGTVWHHRYCTHGAYVVRNKFWLFVIRNLSLKIIPEEIYVVSHHVHHAKSDQPGDPYNASGGFLYCFLADVTHQPIRRNLNEEDYNRAVNMMKHTGTQTNTYQQYQKWGSLANPGLSVLHWVLNWGFWYGVFYLIGGHPLAFAMFGGAGFWAVGVRTFNYEGHGKGENKQREGIDFNRKDMSINQAWPGIVAGEWHNNHHLFPQSARSGFLWYQIDSAWYFIRTLSFIGAISSYTDSKEAFRKQYLLSEEKEEHRESVEAVVIK
ncbi:MAG: acyl-CoA desaturase [Cyclobacteriaceae bacterium]|nr:acyl-CoA desaturase [Cyclobacteriaceae bacterium]